MTAITNQELMEAIKELSVKVDAIDYTLKNVVNYQLQQQCRQSGFTYQPNQQAHHDTFWQQLRHNPFTQPQYRVNPFYQQTHDNPFAQQPAFRQESPKPSKEEMEELIQKLNSIMEAVEKYK